MLVTWVSMSIRSIAQPQVAYGLSQSNLDMINTQVTSTRFLNFFNHRVLLKGLTPNTTYCKINRNCQIVVTFVRSVYKVGSQDSGFSPTFHFHTLQSDEPNWSPTLAIYGDLGLKNAQSLPLLTEQVGQRMYDTVYHIGKYVHY